MEKVTVDRVVRFCFEKFLDVMKNREHKDPFEEVKNALMAEFNLSNEAAHSLCKPPYWVLMNEKILECYYADTGTYWKLEKPDCNIDVLVKKALGTNRKNGEYNYGPTMEARLEMAR